MQHTTDTSERVSNIAAPEQSVGMSQAALDNLASARELSDLLERAGTLAASMGVSLDTWMKDAWTAYVDARPGLREHIADMQLLAQLNELRQSGKLGQA